MSRCPFCAEMDLDRPCGFGPENMGSGLIADYPDSYPVTEGHTLVMPVRHVQYLQDLTLDESKVLWLRVQAVVNRVGECNVGINNGVTAGQTVPHLHVHVIPRRMGDTPDPRGGVRWVVPSTADYWSR